MSRRRFVIEIVEEDLFIIDPSEMRDQISLALSNELKIEEDISFSIEEIE